MRFNHYQTGVNMVAVNSSLEQNQDRQPAESSEVNTASENAMVDQTQPAQKHGQLVIIGGAEDKEGDCRILREFLRRSGGMEARVVVMTVATGLPGEVGAQYVDIFERLGVG